MRPNYFIFIGYLKTGGRGGGSSKAPEPPLDPPLNENSEQHLDLKQCWICRHACLLDVLEHTLVCGKYSHVLIKFTHNSWTAICIVHSEYIVSNLWVVYYFLWSEFYRNWCDTSAIVLCYKGVVIGLISKNVL